jgi:hypothetical protein
MKRHTTPFISLPADGNGGARKVNLDVLVAATTPCADQTLRR